MLEAENDKTCCQKFVWPSWLRVWGAKPRLPLNQIRARYYSRWCIKSLQQKSVTRKLDESSWVCKRSSDETSLLSKVAIIARLILSHYAILKLRTNNYHWEVAQYISHFIHDTRQINRSAKEAIFTATETTWTLRGNIISKLQTCWSSRLLLESTYWLRNFYRVTILAYEKKSNKTKALPAVRYIQPIHSSYNWVVFTCKRILPSA